MRFIAVLKRKFDEIDLNNRPIKENLIYAELSMRWKYHYDCNVHSITDFSLLIANQISYRTLYNSIRKSDGQKYSKTKKSLYYALLVLHSIKYWIRKTV
jgi:hypothetical protein